MREIKFRAWDKELKRMFTPALIDNDNQAVYWDFEDYRNSISADCILMQYTGLKDKNGREIYEGDIVELKYWDGQMRNENESAYTEEIEIIEFYNGTYCPIPIVNKCEDPWYSYGYYDFKIIGNIYENPELMNR